MEKEENEKYIIIKRRKRRKETKLTEWFVLIARLERSLSKLWNPKKERREYFKFDSSTRALHSWNWKSAEAMIVSGWMKLSDCNRGSNIMPNVRIYPSVLLYRTDVCFIRLNMDVIIRDNTSRNGIEEGSLLVIEIGYIKEIGKYWWILRKTN